MTAIARGRSRGDPSAPTTSRPRHRSLASSICRRPDRPVMPASRAAAAAVAAASRSFPASGEARWAAACRSAITPVVPRRLARRPSRHRSARPSRARCKSCRRPTLHSPRSRTARTDRPHTRPPTPLAILSILDVLRPPLRRKPRARPSRTARCRLLLLRFPLPPPMSPPPRPRSRLSRSRGAACTMRTAKRLLAVKSAISTRTSSTDSPTFSLRPRGPIWPLRSRKPEATTSSPSACISARNRV